MISKRFTVYLILKEEKKWNENLGDTITFGQKMTCHTIFLDMVQLMNKLGYDQYRTQWTKISFYKLSLSRQNQLILLFNIENLNGFKNDSTPEVQKIIFLLYFGMFKTYSMKYFNWWYG